MGVLASNEGFSGDATSFPSLRKEMVERDIAARGVRDELVLDAMRNVRRENLAGVLATLPSLKNPTVAALSDPEWVAINTIVEEKIVRQLIPKLKSARAEGIVEYPLNKIVY